jgi:hypothetical protein
MMEEITRKPHDSYFPIRNNGGQTMSDLVMNTQAIKEFDEFYDGWVRANW